VNSLKLKLYLWLLSKLIYLILTHNQVCYNTGNVWDVLSGQGEPGNVRENCPVKVFREITYFGASQIAKNILKCLVKIMTIFLKWWVPNFGPGGINEN